MIPKQRNFKIKQNKPKRQFTQLDEIRRLQAKFEQDKQKFMQSQEANSFISDILDEFEDEEEVPKPRFTKAYMQQFLESRNYQQKQQTTDYTSIFLDPQTTTLDCQRAYTRFCQEANAHLLEVNDTQLKRLVQFQYYPPLKRYNDVMQIIKQIQGIEKAMNIDFPPLSYFFDKPQQELFDMITFVNASLNRALNREEKASEAVQQQNQLYLKEQEQQAILFLEQLYIQTGQALKGMNIFQTDTISQQILKIEGEKSFQVRGMLNLDVSDEQKLINVQNQQVDDQNDQNQQEQNLKSNKPQENVQQQKFVLDGTSKEILNQVQLTQAQNLIPEAADERLKFTIHNLQSKNCIFISQQINASELLKMVYQMSSLKTGIQNSDVLKQKDLFKAPRFYPFEVTFKGQKFCAIKELFEALIEVYPAVVYLCQVDDFMSPFVRNSSYWKLREKYVLFCTGCSQHTVTVVCIDMHKLFK